MGMVWVFYLLQKILEGFIAWQHLSVAFHTLYVYYHSHGNKRSNYKGFKMVDSVG